MKCNTTTDIKHPYKYNENMLDDCYRLARFGCTNDEISEFFKINVVTFAKYVHDIPELYAALQKGRLLDSLKVVDSLHKQALGYEVIETEEAEHMDRNGKVRILNKTTKKYIQPNVTAAIYLLKTRHGDKWMDIIKSEKTQNLNILVKNVDFSDISTEDLLTLKGMGVKRLPQEFRKQTINLPPQDVHGN